MPACVQADQVSTAARLPTVRTTKTLQSHPHVVETKYLSCQQWSAMVEREAICDDRDSTDGDLDKLDYSIMTVRHSLHWCLHHRCFDNCCLDHEQWEVRYNSVMFVCWSLLNSWFANIGSYHVITEFPERMISIGPTRRKIESHLVLQETIAMLDQRSYHWR